SRSSFVRHGRTSKRPSVCHIPGLSRCAAASVVCMADDSREEPEDEFRDLLREFLAGNTNIDPAQLASAAGLPHDPAAIERLIQQLQSALSSSSEGVNWGLA